MSEVARVRLWRLVIAVATLALWEAGAAYGWFNAFWTSSPSRIAIRLFEQIVSGEILPHVALTVAEALAGLVIGVVAGMAFGLLLGVNRTLGAVFEPFIMAVNSLPRVALGPLIVMFFGIGPSAKIVLAFSLVVVVVMLNTFEGVRSIDPRLLHVMTMLKASRWQVFVKCLLPNSVPWVFSAVRASIAFAIIGVLVGEFISARAGIGYLIDRASGAFDITGILTPLIVLMVVAVTLDLAIQRLNTHVLRWRTDPRV